METLLSAARTLSKKLVVSGSTSKCESNALPPPNEFPCRLQMNLNKYFPEDIERKWKGPFTFILTADTQFGLIEKYIKKKPDPRWDEEIKLTSATIHCINKMRPKPRFLVVCGDMLDALPKDPQGISLRKEQYEDFVKVFQDLDPDIPLVCACGNHDICDEPTVQSYKIYRQQFGPDFFSFWVGGVKFSVINSQYFKKPDNLPEQTEKQEKFINMIGDPEAKFQVVFQHIPFFVSDPDEDDVSYLNIEKEMRYKLMNIMNNAGVDFIFCGHYHRNGGGSYKNFDQIVTTALGGSFGQDPSGFRLCQVTDHGIFHQYIPVILELPPTPILSVPKTLVEGKKSRSRFLKSLHALTSSLNLPQPAPQTEEECEADCIENATVTSEKAKFLMLCKDATDSIPLPILDENKNRNSERNLGTKRSTANISKAIKKFSSSNILSITPKPTKLSKVIKKDAKKHPHNYVW